MVIAESNNPRLLNPDFLERNRIVPEKWTTQQVLVTPPFATVQYADGFTVTVEETKLQFAADPTKVNDWPDLLPKVAIQFMEVLPHVVYKDVGMNFVLTADSPTGKVAEHTLMNNMLIKGEWFNFHGGLTGIVLDLQYRNQQPHLLLKVAVEEAIEQGKKILKGHIVIANYHHEFTPDQSVQRVAYIRQLFTKHQELLEQIKNLPLGPN